MHDLPAITREILREYVLHVRGDHGVLHWARVLENGLRLADAVGADREVVTLFALFHDSRRVNEHDDPDHGRRGGEFARTLRGRLVHLEEARFEVLFEACRAHTESYPVSDPTLQVCWDADRLDLGRVGITPDPDRLATDAARGALPWAHERAVRHHVPVEVLEAWGVPAHPGPRADR
ncbi:MAG: HD domain-containing protein [bacterium]